MLLTKVPLEDFTSLIMTCPLRSAQISACALDSTFESKYPFRGVGTVFAFVCRPIFSTSGAYGTAMCFLSNVPVIGSKTNTMFESTCPIAASDRAPFCCV